MIRGAVRVSRVRRLEPTPRRGTAHTSLVAAAISYINARGGFAWKNQSGILPVGKRFVHVSRPGIPDVIGVLNWCYAREGPASDCAGTPGHHVGRLIAVEVKTGSARVSAVQRRVHEELRRRGALVLVIRDIRELEDRMVEARMTGHETAADGCDCPLCGVARKIRNCIRVLPLPQ